MNGKMRCKKENCIKGGRSLKEEIREIKKKKQQEVWRENFVFEHTKNRLSTKKGSETEEVLHNNKKNHYDYSVL